MAKTKKNIEPVEIVETGVSENNVEVNNELSVLEQVDLQLLETELKEDKKVENSLSEIIDSILDISPKIINCTLTKVNTLYKCEIRFNQRFNSSIELYPGSKEFENTDLNLLKYDISVFMVNGMNGHLTIV